MPADTNSLDFTERLFAPLRLSPTPLLIWHGTGGERVELSGRVFDNWVAKSANLLAEEFDAGPGTRVLLRLPAHWKSLAIAFAVLATGAEAHVPSPHGPAQPDGTGGTASGDTAGTGTDPDVVLTIDPAADAGRHGQAEIVGVELGSLALSFSGDLPAGAMDYAAEVRGFGDVYLADPVPAGTTALRDAAGTLTYAGLFTPTAPAGTPAGAAAREAAGGTALLGPGVGLGEAVRAAAAVWGAGAALVLLGDGVEPTERMLASERVSRKL